MIEVIPVLIGLLVVVVGVACFAAWRWRRIVRQGGIEVALRWRPTDDDRGWHRGIGRYEGEELAWFRVFSLRLGPDRLVRRSDLQIGERREPTETEEYGLPTSATVLQCRLAGAGSLDIALAPGALIGFLSWLESAPPGRKVPRTG